MKQLSDHFYRKRSGTAWEKTGAQKALRLFHRASRDVPAYKHFLKQHGVDPLKIKTIEDFKNVPPIDKKTYLRAYSLKELVFPASQVALHTFSASSGSTGTPFLWPRGDTHENEGMFLHELIFNKFFGIKPTHSALGVVAFSMGTWIAGTYTLASMKAMSNKGYRLMTVTPGIDLETLLDVVKPLISNFKTVILAGYPPYIKDVLDYGREAGIRWHDVHMKLLLAGEAFSEGFRGYLIRRSGIKDPFRDIISLYGTADAAILAHETPLSIYIRRKAADKKQLAQALFHDERLPSLFQYHPDLKFFEVQDDQLLFTAEAGIPLIRYRIGDRGGVIAFEEMAHHFANRSMFPVKQFLWKLPFVYLFGRSDLTASIYAVLVYPEHIKSALEQRIFSSYITGKFVISTEHKRSYEQHLLVRVELKPHIRQTRSLEKLLVRSLLEMLNKHNIEYRKLYHSLGERVVPRIQLVTHGDPLYFRPGTKQRWVKKD